MKFSTYRGTDLINRYAESRGLDVCFLDPELGIDVTETHFVTPKNFYQIIKECQSRYLYFPLSLHLGEFIHANSLLYDRVYKTLERFEPHGSGGDYIPNLDTIIEYMFLINDLPIAKYYPPLTYCPQVKQEIVNTENFGYCQPWSTFYLLYRMQGYSRFQILEYWDRLTPEQLDEKIRAFGDLIHYRYSDFPTVENKYTYGYFPLSQADIEDWKQFNQEMEEKYRNS